MQKLLSHETKKLTSSKCGDVQRKKIDLLKIYWKLLIFQATLEQPKMQLNWISFSSSRDHQTVVFLKLTVILRPSLRMRTQIHKSENTTQYTSGLPGKLDICRLYDKGGSNHD